MDSSKFKELWKVNRLDESNDDVTKIWLSSVGSAYLGVGYRQMWQLNHSNQPTQGVWNITRSWRVINGTD